MSELLPFIVAGLTAGSLYGLAGLGLVLTYRTSGVLNLGHGAIAAGAAALFYTLHITYSWPWAAAALVTVASFALVGALVLERVTRSLGDVPVAVLVVATVGILLAINGGINLLFGPAVRRFPEFLPTSGFEAGGVFITWSQVISFAVATVLGGLLYTFLRFSRLGVAMRAVVDDRALVSLTGENPAAVRRLAWGVGSAFAAISGVLLGPSLGLDANLLTFLVVQAFGACAIGLFKSLPLTYAGGLAVGVAAAVSNRYLLTPPWNGIPSVVPYLALIVVLLVVPNRHLPSYRQSIRSLASGRSQVDRRVAVPGLVAVLIGLIAVPHVVGTHLPVWTNALSYSVIFGSLALLVWMSGQLSLCHMAFAALGATTFAHLREGGAPWALAVLGAGLLTVPAGALVAVPAIRLSGVYLALVTLGFGIFMQNVIFQTDLMFGDSTFISASRPKLGGFDGNDDTHLYYLFLGVALLGAGVLLMIARSRLGRFLRAMAESPTMLSTHGLGVNITRLLVFCGSAFLAAVGGAMALTQSGAVSGVAFGPLQSMVLVAVLAMCGTRLIRSAVLAAALFAIVPGYVEGFGVDQQLFGFGLAAIVAAIVVAKRKDISEWVGATAAATEERRAAPRSSGLGVQRVVIADGVLPGRPERRVR